MKKILSVLLSLLMIMSLFTVLTGVAVANTYTVTATAGGTASVSGQTYKAVPYFGNTFAGWFLPDGDSPVSTQREFTTDEYTSLVARFNVYNQIVDGSFENGIAGQDYFNQYTGGPGKQNVIANAPAGSDAIHGNKVLECVPAASSTTNLYLLHIPVTVEKNKTYTFHLSYYMPDFEAHAYLGLKGESFTNAWTAYGTVDKWSLHWQKEGTQTSGAWSFMGDQNPSTVHAKTVNANITVDPNSWIDVLFMFNAGDDATVFAEGEDTATMFIQFGLANNNANSFYIDNVCFSEAAQILSSTDIVADKGGYINAIGDPQKSLTPIVYYNTDGNGVGQAADGYIVADSTYYSVANTSASQYKATAYSDNLFDGWYDENDELVTNDTIVNVGTQKELTAKFINNNQIPDGDFSAGKGVGIWQNYNGGPTRISVTEGTGMTGAGVNLNVTSNCLMNIQFPVDVKKNTDYVLSYNFKINSWSATAETATPVYGQMISGSPSGANTWGHWPSLGGWKITIRNAEDYTKSMTVTSTQKHCIPQIKFADIVANCGEDAWLEFILEFNTGSDTTQGNDGNMFATSDVATMYMAFGFNFAVTNIDYDNVTFYEDSFAPNFIMKEAARVSRVGIGTVAAGVPYNFKVEAAEGTTVNVSYKDTPIEAVSGVYTATVSADDKNIVITTNVDEDLPDAGKDFDGNDLTKYDHDVYTKPIWEGDTVYHETVAFYGDRTEALLTYPIDSVVSVRSFDLQTYYVKGLDFDVVDGKLVLLPGSSIPVLGYLPLSPAGTGSWASDLEGYDITGASGGSLYPKTVVVTYKHTDTWADLEEDGYTGLAEESKEDELNVFTKLRNGEDVHIVFYGDSMTSGWSISGGKSDVYTAENDGTTTDSGLYTAPYAPSWMQMFIDGLKKEYPEAYITWENLSLGGKASDWGKQNFDARYSLLKNKDIDLFLIGWGINDAGAGVAPATFKANDHAIIEKVRDKCPDVSVLLYSGHCTNLLAEMYDEVQVLGYQEMVKELANEIDNTAAVDLTNIFYEIMSSKESIDMFENNLNHTNDFGCRLYSQVMLSAMSKKYADNDAVAETPVAAETDYTSITLTAIDGYEYSMDGINWQTSPVFTGLKAGTEYTFYQRIAKTENVFASAASSAVISTLAKAAADAPAAPVLANKTATSVTLIAVEGYEYKLEGGEWQTSPVFEGLQPISSYTFYQRVAETETASASDSSEGTVVVTEKITQDAPPAPTVVDKTETSVTLGELPSIEYSMDGISWQTSPVFEGLTAGTTYTFYQRFPETPAAFASPVSEGTVVTTLDLYTGWKDEGGYKVYYENGVMLRKQWINYKGVWYYVDGYGHRVTDSWVEKDGNKRYVTAQGWLATNRWINYKGTWYYVDANGDRVRETWVNGANGKCWLTKEGYMAVNRWINYKGTWYYVGSNGARVTETWKDGANGKCWLTKEGYMAVNRWINYKGTWYYVGSNGARVTSTWIDGANGKCWLTEYGYMAVNKWINYKGTWYYVGANGARVTEQWVMGQHGICYLSKQGYMVAGCWKTIDGKAYQFAANGVCLNK